MVMERKAEACRGHREGKIGGLSALAVGVALSVLASQGFGQEKPAPASAPSSQPAPAPTSHAAPALTSQSAPDGVDGAQMPSKEILGGSGGPELPPPPEWKKPVPFGFLVEGSVLSDYVCRKGFDMSYYRGQGNPKANYQLLVAPSLSTKDLFAKGLDLGTLSLPVWYEWYSAQQHITPWDSHDFQEVDYMPTWTYGIPKTPLTFSLTYDYYELPPYKNTPGGGVEDNGQEFWFGLALDDSCIFGKPVFSPYVTVVQDIDHIGGTWVDLGVKHDFKLAEFGCSRTPLLKDMTLTPGIVLGIDHRYDDVVVGNRPGTHFSCITYGLTGVYDLSKALKIPKKYGDIYIKGFLDFKQELHDYHVHGTYPVLRNDFYEGVALGYSW